MPNVVNPNDFKVVKLKNDTNFNFTHDMGCMYNGSPISGVKGVLGIAAGEELMLPYHVGHRLAVNLAKAVMVKSDDGNPPKDAMGNVMVKAIWSEEQVETMKKHFLTELYSEERPIAQTETDRLLAKVEEFKALAEKLLAKDATPVAPAPVEQTTPTDGNGLPDLPVPMTFADKQDVIAELEKRGIAHDKRQNKSNLEKLLS